MASSVCAFAVSPAPATSFISPPLYRTSRQWRCVYSARQQKEPVRRLRKGLARFVVVLADEESDVQLGISRKRPPIAKPTTPRHFSTASTQSGSGLTGQWSVWWCPQFRPSAVGRYLPFIRRIRCHAGRCLGSRQRSLNLAARGVDIHQLAVA